MQRRYSDSRSIIKEINPISFRRSRLSKTNFIETAKLCSAYWIHNGDLTKPHVELASGLCSNGFIRMALILQYQNLSYILAREILKNLPSVVELEKIDWVIGSAYSALGLSKDVAIILGAQWAPMQKDANERQVWVHPQIPKNETVLHIEDVVSTGKAAVEVRDALGSANIIPYVPVLASRSIDKPQQEITAQILKHGIVFCPLFHFKEFWAVPPAECPLCACDSVRLKPKVGNNWAQLIKSIKISS